jgi:hypothetical protein
MESQSVFEVAEVFVTKRILKSLKSSSDEVLESQSVFESTCHWSETTDFAQVDVPFSSRLCI